MGAFAAGQLVEPLQVRLICPGPPRLGVSSHLNWVAQTRLNSFLCSMPHSRLQRNSHLERKLHSLQSKGRFWSLTSHRPAAKAQWLKRSLFERKDRTMEQKTDLEQLIDLALNERYSFLLASSFLHYSTLRRPSIWKI